MTINVKMTADFDPDAYQCAVQTIRTSDQGVESTDMMNPGEEQSFTVHSGARLHVVEYSVEKAEAPVAGSQDEGTESAEPATVGQDVSGDE